MSFILTLSVKLHWSPFSLLLNIVKCKDMPSKFVKKETLESLISLWYLKSLKSILLVVIQLTFQFRRWKDKTVLDCTETIRNHGDSLDMWHHLCLVILWVWGQTHICHQTLSGYHQFTDSKDNWSKQWYFHDKYFLCRVFWFSLFWLVSTHSSPRSGREPDWATPRAHH